MEDDDLQTFLPYSEFERSARVLDMKRLGKQRVEAKQILNVLTLGKSGWRNHPASLMWLHHEQMLSVYGMIICSEWRSRGYQDSLLPFFTQMSKDLKVSAPPPWLGDPEFHRSHRSNLLRKDPEHYGKYFTDVPPDLPYIWPVRAQQEA